MRTDVTDAEIDRYRQDGFLVVEDLLTPAETAELKEAVLSTAAGYGNRRIINSDLEMNDKEDHYSSVFRQRLNLWKVNPTVKRYMMGTEMGRLVERLTGVRQRVWHDQMLEKRAWGNPTAWHLDNPYWSFSSFDAISVWIALEDATLANGCMWYLPGSHRLARHDRNVGIGQDLGGLFKVYPDMLANAQPVAAPLRAGSCGFHNGMTAHGAGANMTAGNRTAMTCGYMPAGSTFNGSRNILAKERFERLKAGDSLDDDTDNPLVGTGGSVMR